MKDCKFCDKKGLLILPLRYAAVAGESAKNLLPKLPSTLGKDVSDLDLVQGQYAPRLLRDGFLYVLVVRAGVKSWQGYVVTEDAFLYKFPVETPPPSKVVFSCDPASCGIDASCISVEKVETVEKMFFLFSPSLLTLDKLKEYKSKADSMAASGKMQVFKPKAWVDGDTQQLHSFKPAQLAKHSPEWLLYKQGDKAASSPLGKVMAQQLWPALKCAYEGVPPPAADQPAPGRLGMLEDKLVRLKGAVFAVHDHIGITQELNDFRNAALEGVQYYLAAIDQDGVSNQHRMQVYEAIEELKAAFLAGVAQSRKDFLDTQMKQGDQTYYAMQMNNAALLRKQGRLDDAKRIEDDVAQSKAIRAANYTRLIEEGKAHAASDWQKKYASRLDEGEMTSFHNTLSGHLKKAFAKVEERHVQHMQWFKSARLVDAFDMYDPANIPSGYSFALHSGMCTFGISGCKAADPTVDEWIKASSIERKNLYARGLYFNQTELIEAVQQANADIAAAAGEVEHASDINSGKIIKAVSGVVKSLKSIDSAFDEWARNHVGKNATQFAVDWGASKEIVLYHKVSELTRTVFRAGLGGTFDKVLTARISGLLYARLVAVGKSIEYKELMLALPKDKVAAHQRERVSKRAEQRRVEKASVKAEKTITSQINESSLEKLIKDAQKKAQLKLSLNDIKGNEKPPTNNYHQVRIGVIVGCIEMIALGEKLTHFENNTEGWLTISGSVLAIGSIVLDTYYSAAKSIREISTVKSFKEVADIVRGGFKIGAGIMSAGAGGIGVYLDVLKLKSENDGTLKLIYGVRILNGIFSVGFTLAAAYSYTSPLLEHLASAYATYSIRYRALTAASEIALALAARVQLLVWVARLNWIGLALTAVEIGYLLLKDDDLQNWAEQCCFRKIKSKTTWLGKTEKVEGFSSVLKELEALEKASQVVGIGG